MKILMKILMKMEVCECVSRHFKPFVQLWHDRLTFCRGGESKAWDEVPCETAQSEDTQSNIHFISLHHLQFIFKGYHLCIVKGSCAHLGETFFTLSHHTFCTAKVDSSPGDLARLQ